MPCYTERTITADLKAADQDVLKRGLEAAGFKIQETRYGMVVRKGYQSATIENGKIEASESDASIIGAIKQAHASEAVRTAAEMYGLSYQLQQDPEDPFHWYSQQQAGY